MLKSEERYDMRSLYLLFRRHCELNSIFEITRELLRFNKDIFFLFGKHAIQILTYRIFSGVVFSVLL